MAYSNSRKSAYFFMGIKTFKLNDRYANLFIFSFRFLSFRPISFSICVPSLCIVNVYRCTCRVQFYEGGHVEGYRREWQCLIKDIDVYMCMF